MRLPGRLVGADEGLQPAFALGDGGFGARNLGFEFLYPFFYLLALDWVQALRLGVVGTGDLVLVAIYGLRNNRRAADSLLQFFCAAFFPPAIVFVVAGINFYPTLAHFENSRRQFVDEIAVVRDEDHR